MGRPYFECFYGETVIAYGKIESDGVFVARLPRTWIWYTGAT